MFTFVMHNTRNEQNTTIIKFVSNYKLELHLLNSLNGVTSFSENERELYI